VINRARRLAVVDAMAGYAGSGRTRTVVHDPLGQYDRPVSGMSVTDGIPEDLPVLRLRFADVRDELHLAGDCGEPDDR
jgi:hypothetical protein